VTGGQDGSVVVVVVGAGILGCSIALAGRDRVRPWGRRRGA
jgi:hypothetical protein